MFVRTQNCRKLRVVLHKPLLKKELQGVRDGLAKPEVQPILSGAICSILLLVRSFDVVQCVGGRSRMCVRHAWEISPTLIVVLGFYLTKKSKMKQTRTLPVEILGSLNFIIIITFILLFIITIIIFSFIIIIIIYFMCSPNLLSFSINKAKVKFAKINIALIYLHSRFLILFMKVILNSLTKIKHHV